MNLGKNRWHSEYICDKCGQNIPYRPQKGFDVYHYYRSERSNPQHKDFDLCNVCEKKLKKWLKDKEIPTIQDIVERFQKYEEE